MSRMDLFDTQQFLKPERSFKEYSFNDNDYLLKRKLFALVNGLNGQDISDSDYTELSCLYNCSSLKQDYTRLIFAIYSKENKRILVARRFSLGRWTFPDIVRQLLKHKRIHQYKDKVFSIQIDFVMGDSETLDLYRVGMKHQGKRHFEIGVDGLVLMGPDGKKHLFPPGDAYVNSIMGMKQLRTHLHNKHGEDYVRASEVKSFQSESFLLTEDNIVPLYRGLPRVGELTQAKLEQAVKCSIQHVLENQKADGRFLYYYDPSQDSYVDFEHPKRDPIKNPYYNILRHSGGALTCVFYEKYFSNNNSIGCIGRAIKYLMDQSVYYQKEGIEAAYIYSEKKSKLGGSGLALYLLAEYQHLTGDKSFDKYGAALATHLLNQITSTGEFIYYNIYLDKEITEEENFDYFSFYYPGEALCGLAKYLPFLSDEDQTYYLKKIKQALDFLIKVRPEVRASEYSVLPSDSWLMMAIMELYPYGSIMEQAYTDFVFSDATKMIERMYKVTDAPYPDYAGAFYYQFGDYPYSDGARMEGIMAAYELAVKMDNTEMEAKLWPALCLGGWSVMHLVNTDEALYSVKRPELAKGGIRFKYTRQWFRIDTIQHVAGFYAKLLPYWERAVAAGYHI